MAILNQLGINFTTFYCFLIFGFTFFFLKEILFRPYYQAFEEREKRTKGGEMGAKDLQAKTLMLQKEYELEARQLNSEIKDLFDQGRAQGLKQFDHITAEGRRSAEQIVEDVRIKVAAEVKKAQDQMSVEIPGVALAITKKMLD